LQHSIEYKFGQYRLTINFWFLIIFLLVQTGLNELGFWQLSRAKEKQIRLEKLANSHVAVLDSLKLVDPSLIANFAKVQLQTELAIRINLLIENKIQQGKLGYHVLNVVKDVSSNKHVLVNRGWIEGKANRNELPQIKLPPRDWDIHARIYPINSQVFSGDAELENYVKIVRLPVMDVRMKSLLEEKFKIELQPYLLRLDTNVASGFNVNWEWVSMSPDKHLAYAIQWFALSFAFLLISLFVLIKKDIKKIENNE